MNVQTSNLVEILKLYIRKINAITVLIMKEAIGEKDYFLLFPMWELAGRVRQVWPHDRLVRAYRQMAREASSASPTPNEDVNGPL